MKNKDLPPVVRIDDVVRIENVRAESSPSLNYLWLWTLIASGTDCLTLDTETVTKLLGDEPSYPNLTAWITANLNETRVTYDESVARSRVHSTVELEGMNKELLKELDEPGREYLEQTIFAKFDQMKSPTCKPMYDLIWSYWHEEGMLVQTMNAICMRFQNRRIGCGNDPLANFELRPLKRVSDLIWGFIEAEPHRLSIARRAFEYDHEMGLTLHGKAVPPMHSADSRARFLTTFHDVLNGCARFFVEDDDTNRVADAFGLLQMLKDFHMVLREGAHNQFRGLPRQAFEEMRLMQIILSSPEVLEFLRGRYMVDYREPWMGAVDAMKSLQGWTDTPVSVFRDLAYFGQKLLLSVRFVPWGRIDDPRVAATWARFWRKDIQGYIYSYRTATGVDVSTDLSEVNAGERSARYLPPSVHLRERLAAQGRRA